MIDHMGERLRFGIDTPECIRPTKVGQPAAMFPDGEDLPLFSGTPVPAIERPFVPDDHSLKQGMLPGMPQVDYEYVLARDRASRRRRSPVAVPPGEDIFTAAATTASAPRTDTIEPAGHLEAALAPATAPQERRREAGNGTEKLHPL